MASAESTAPRHGMLVFTKDGVELGRVKIVDNRNFKIDVPLAYDYWVDRRYIERIGDNFVMLSLTHQQVTDHRSASSNVDEPLISPDNTPLADTRDTSPPRD